eukprot:TRINITY_DN9925_c0_g1_i9.p1 TRINITY_DN9925_c0_g1~~TRINITY_DN9925_c0_g1_i9.p1  ORF type:complete len:387 (-),score=6.72 TRINITY_DN9925_c0_g1_i9:395-1555(-)
MKKVHKILHERNNHIVYLRCLAHLLNLAMEVFIYSPVFRNIQTLIEKFQYLLNISGSRKHRYVSFLEAHTTGGANLMPKYSPTRWATWFDACYYLGSKLEVVAEFIKEENKEQESQTTISLAEIIGNEALFFETKACILFVQEFTPFLVSTIRDFEKEEATSYEMFERLLGALERLDHATTHEALICPTTDAFINYALSQYLSITATHARALNKEFIEAVEKMASKLKKLVSDYEAGGFLHSLSVLDPCKKSTWRSEFRNLMRRLPFYEANKQIIEADLIKYCMYTPPNTKANLTGYCQSLKNQFPALSQQTIQYLLYYCGSREELCFFQTNISRYQNQLDNSAPQPMDCEQFQYLKGKTLRSQKGAGRRGGKDSWRGQSGGRINF